MRIIECYSHLNGLEYLLVHKPSLWREIQKIVAAVDAKQHRTKVSNEKSMKGKLLFSPKAMNAAFGKAFKKAHWQEQRTRYWVTENASLIRKTLTLPASEQKKQIIAAGRRPIQSYNQTDFVKERIAVEIQFGKYAFVAYDLFVKHMAFFIGDVIDLGIEILPMKELQENMSS